MSVISGEGKQEFIIAKRELDEEEDCVTLIPVYLVISAPEETGMSEMKEILEKAGEYDPSMWREHRVIPSSQWENQKNWTPHLDHIHNWAVDLIEEEQLFYCTHAPAAHGTTYDELVSRFYDEKRITLRLPWSLHIALNRAAGDMTLNSYCIKTLANAVGYGDLVEEFEAQREAQRRKPGRPKKVQDSE